MGRLIFVRHSRPEIIPGQPSSTWGLTPEGRASAADLARRLLQFEPAWMVSSAEPKARETAVAMAEVFDLPVAIDRALVEHRRETSPFREAATHEALIARMFSEPSALVLGEETADEAHARFAEAVERVPERGAGMIVTHGTVMTLWLSRRFGADPMGLWRSLSTPCAAVLTETGESFQLIA